MFDWLAWENPVSFWWVFLSSVSAINILLWFWTRMYRYPGVYFSSVFEFRKNPKSIIWFSSLYVFVCAFRSFMPRADVQRIVLFDTWFSSVFLGRTIATIAELAFVTQWAIVLMLFSEAAKDSWARKISLIIIPVITVAEIFSWYAVIRTHYIGNVVEESLWGLTYVGIGSAIASLWFKLRGPMRLAAGVAVVFCALYVLFMFTVDVPMYYVRMMQDLAAQKPYLSFTEGIYDLNTRWIVTHDIQQWKQEIPWKTLYFSFAVWVSLILCYVPLSTDKIKKYLN
jgi:hypothetical protein